MEWKDFLDKKSSAAVYTNAPIAKKTIETPIVERVIVKEDKKISEFSDDELYEEVNKRKAKKVNETIIDKKDSVLYASCILDEEYDDGIKHEKTISQVNENELLSHVMDIL